MGIIAHTFWILSTFAAGVLAGAVMYAAAYDRGVKKAEDERESD